MGHPLCARNPPNRHAADFGFICTRKQAQRGRAVSWDRYEEVGAESCHLSDFPPILFPASGV